MPNIDKYGRSEKDTKKLGKKVIYCSCEWERLPFFWYRFIAYQLKMKNVKIGPWIWVRKQRAHIFFVLSAQFKKRPDPKFKTAHQVTHFTCHCLPLNCFIISSNAVFNNFTWLTHQAQGCKICIAYEAI